MVENVLVYFHLWEVVEIINIKKNLFNTLISNIHNYHLPNGEILNYLQLDDICTIKAQFDLSYKELEIIALKHNIIPERYLRNFTSLNIHNQLQLLQASVCIVGLGGLGGVVAENLARIGIGHLKLIDGDRFIGHNLNRQLLSSTEKIGQLKSKMAEQRLRSINPAVFVEIHSEFLTENNASEFLKNSNVIVDCLDTYNARHILKTAAQIAKTPLVAAAIAGLTGFITVFFADDLTIETFYDDQNDPNTTAETILGCLPQTATIIGALEATEVVKLVLNNESDLRNRFLIIDLADNTFELVDKK